MTAAISKTQIDLLGDRLRQGITTEADLRMLDDHRRSFGPAYETVVRAFLEHLHIEPTGRPAKSTGALVEKLRRETIRLSQVQDIAGCRVVLPDVFEQDRVVAALLAVFPQAAVMDRRESPSFGYRAVHVVVEVGGKFVEVQIRTDLQHTWAELSEKLSDISDPAIKYGGGPDDARKSLDAASFAVHSVEQTEKRIAEVIDKDRQSDSPMPEAALVALTGAREEMARFRHQLQEQLRKAVDTLIPRDKAAE